MSVCSYVQIFFFLPSCLWLCFAVGTNEHSRIPRTAEQRKNKSCKPAAQDQSPLPRPEVCSFVRSLTHLLAASVRVARTRLRYPFFTSSPIIQWTDVHHVVVPKGKRAGKKTYLLFLTPNQSAHRGQLASKSPLPARAVASGASGQVARDTSPLSPHESGGGGIPPW